MATAQKERQLSVEELLKAADRLPNDQLERLVEQMLFVRARRRAPGLAPAEAELLLKINTGLPPALQHSYERLSAKEREETITPAEQQELLALIEQAEQLNYERVKALVELAQLRQTSLKEL